MENGEHNHGWAAVAGGAVTAAVLMGVAAVVASMMLGGGQASDGAMAGLLDFPAPRMAAQPVVPAVDDSPVAQTAPASPGGGSQQASPRSATPRQPVRPQPAPGTWGTPPQDAHQPGPPTPPEVDLNDPGYRRAAEAAFQSPPAAAVVIIEDFRSEHRDPLWAPHLDQLLDAAMDRLWWQRIGELVHQRQEVSRQINALRVEQARTNDAAARRRQLQQTEALRQQLDRIATELRDMNYTATEPPDRLDARQLEALRQQRDPGAYAIWKARVRTTVMRTRGVLPWDL